MTYRHRAPVLNPVHSLTAEQHAEIKKQALEKTLNWSTSDGLYGALITKFRAEIKEHYYRWQRRRCCYCSTELHDHKITYDAEHILGKSEYPEYMFEEANLAAACKLCNQYKSDKEISASGLRFPELSRNKDDYSIVHPHLDEWIDHLKFDSVGRIVATDGSSKGAKTILVCGMASLNAARLADQFAIEETVQAETALRTFHEVADVTHKQELLELLSEMARRYDHPGSQAVVETLRHDLQQIALAPPPVFPVASLGNELAVGLFNFATTNNTDGPLLPSPNNAPVVLLPAPASVAPAGPIKLED
ncbi:uncharacterized protein (TIGR02646 family) [Variovorax boronicumulans]|uniref:hypothetical protein n=1 Tax=Variovorax boronicumulans TaxID=436515 RepID=UPI002786068C|nr:hypothetical protein [Variovorax boronicumulans]MDQ0038187.1 uncharacterized protein (TIGR02646 family) [Variovorax boronicumulans]